MSYVFEGCIEVGTICLELVITPTKNDCVIWGGGGGGGDWN